MQLLPSHPPSPQLARPPASWLTQRSPMCLGIGFHWTATVCCPTWDFTIVYSAHNMSTGEFIIIITGGWYNCPMCLHCATAKSQHRHLQVDGWTGRHLPLGIGYSALQYNAALILWTPPTALCRGGTVHSIERFWCDVQWSLATYLKLLLQFSVTSANNWMYTCLVDSIICCFLTEQRYLPKHHCNGFSRRSYWRLVQECYWRCGSVCDSCVYDMIQYAFLFKWY